MGMIGHNNGPTMEPGATWRRHCWTTARQALLPTLPVEVVRTRVRRANELGLDYRTYASVRAQTGHDVVAFLFSSNALRVRPLSPALPADRAARLNAIAGATRIGLAVAPLAVSALATNPELDASHPAPHVLAPFPEIAARLRAALGPLPSDRVILIADAPLEADWCLAGRLAACLPAGRFFTA
ncbi:MAG: hypothetical protein JNJ84_08285 [Rhodobacteraceae bacterium]|nr:hypothetical protein [Paracoccaceae bacterium]